MINVNGNDVKAIAISTKSNVSIEKNVVGSSTENNDQTPVS